MIRHLSHVPLNINNETINGIKDLHLERSVVEIEDMASQHHTASRSRERLVCAQCIAAAGSANGSGIHA